MYKIIASGIVGLVISFSLYGVDAKGKVDLKEKKESPTIVPSISPSAIQKAQQPQPSPIQKQPVIAAKESAKEPVIVVADKPKLNEKSHGELMKEDALCFLRPFAGSAILGTITVFGMTGMLGGPKSNHCYFAALIAVASGLTGVLINGREDNISGGTFFKRIVLGVLGGGIPAFTLMYCSISGNG